MCMYNKCYIWLNTKSKLFCKHIPALNCYLHCSKRVTITIRSLVVPQKTYFPINHYTEQDAAASLATTRAFISTCVVGISPPGGNKS